jgi:hypothetical protein
MMHYDITVNDDCEIRLGGDQTSFAAHIFRLMLSKFPSIRVETIDESQANQQTFAHAAETICQEMRTQVPARRNAAVQGHRLERRWLRVDRENAPAPDARGAMGLPESMVGWVNNLHHRPMSTPVWCNRLDEIGSTDAFKFGGLVGVRVDQKNAPVVDARTRVGVAGSRVDRVV